MGNSSPSDGLIGESICYHSNTELGARQARADRILTAARANFGGIRTERLSEVFVARKRVA
jgi:hypothetical protein